MTLTLTTRASPHGSGDRSHFFLARAILRVWLGRGTTKLTVPSIFYFLKFVFYFLKSRIPLTKSNNLLSFSNSEM